MGQALAKCERCIFQALSFQLFVSPEELAAVSRWVLGSSWCDLDGLWRQMEGARESAGLERTSEYVVLSFALGICKESSHVRCTRARQGCPRHVAVEDARMVERSRA